MFIAAALATAAIVGAATRIDTANKAVKRSRSQDRDLARNIGREKKASPVTEKPEFVVLDHPSWGGPLFFTGREAIWWSEEGYDSRHTAATARKIRWIIGQQETRRGLIESGRAGFIKR